MQSILLDQKDDFREDSSSILLWKISYTYTNEKPLLYNENPYCEACSAEVMPVQLKAVLNQHISTGAVISTAC
jgi:hypothetical protein